MKNQSKLRSVLFFSILIFIITLLALLFDQYEYLTQRTTGTLFHLSIVSLIVSMITGPVTGLLVFKFPRIIKLTVASYLFIAIFIAAYGYIQAEFLPECSKQIVSNYQNNRNIDELSHWCLSDSDAARLLNNAIDRYNQTEFEELISHGIQHSNTGCIRLKMAIFYQQEKSIQTSLKQGITESCSNPAPYILEALMDSAKQPGTTEHKIVQLIEILKQHDIPFNINTDDINQAILSHQYHKLNILRHLIDINTPDTHLSEAPHHSNMKNPLSLAIYINDITSTRLLLNAGADTHHKLYTPDYSEAIDLYQFAVEKYQTENNDTERQKLLYIVNEITKLHSFDEYPPINLFSETVNSNSTSPKPDSELDHLDYDYNEMYQAIRNGKLETLKDYIEGKGVDINFAEFENGYSTPLMTAATHNQYDIAAYLISQGADINKHSSEGDDALLIACARNHVDIAKLLIENGASINSSYDTDGRSPVSYAISNGNTELLTYLIQNNADIHAAEHRLGSLFYYAVNSKNKAILQLLLDYGLDINTPHNSGPTALEHAISQENQELIDFIQQHNGN